MTRREGRERKLPSLPSASASAAESTGPLTTALTVRALAIGFAASVVGGLVMAPVLQGGMFFLLSAGVIGWGVARAVYWVTDDRNSPAIRVGALTLAGLTVAIGMGVAASMQGAQPSEIAFLAFPAAVYGGWIVARQR